MLGVGDPERVERPAGVVRREVDGFAQRGFDVGQPRLPMPSVSAEEGAALLAKVKATGITEWFI